nr:retrovirus-related Pol polyprotein from transposon TNT 1-94 [Tanacetum cinerariifolium]
MAEDGKIKIDKFNGHDFGFWKMQIEDANRRLSISEEASLAFGRSQTYRHE